MFNNWPSTPSIAAPTDQCHHVPHARALLSQSILTREALPLPLCCIEALWISSLLADWCVHRPVALSALSCLPMVCVFLWPFVSPLSVSPMAIGHCRYLGLGSVKCLHKGNLYRCKGLVIRVCQSQRALKYMPG